MENETQENSWYIFEQWMKDNGYWGLYVENYDPSYSCATYINDCVDCAFCWDTTKEGYDFWNNVDSNWQNFIKEQGIHLNSVVVPNPLQSAEEQTKPPTQENIDMNTISEAIQQLQQEQELRKFSMKGTLSCVVATYHNATGKDKIEDVNDLSKFSSILNIYLKG